MGILMFLGVSLFEEIWFGKSIWNRMLSSLPLVIEASWRCQETDQSHRYSDLHGKQKMLAPFCLQSHGTGGNPAASCPEWRDGLAGWGTPRGWQKVPRWGSPSQDPCFLGKIATSCFKVNRLSRLTEVVLKDAWLSKSFYKITFR